MTFPKSPAAKRLRLFLASRGLSQRVAASQIGVGAAALSSWLVGRQRPRPEWRAAIEHWSGGIIASADWLTEDEASRVAAVESVRARAERAA